MTRKMVIISVFIMCIALVFIAGCIGEKPLTRDQATIKIASLGSADEPFTLWVDEPGCCKEIFYYEIESDGARTIQSVRESDSKFYFDSTPEEARIILMNGKNDDFMTCGGTDTASVHSCENNKESTIFLTAQVHVPSGTIIIPYGNHRSSGGSDTGMDTVRAYSAYRMISTGGQRII
jgi:hypothetical protein